MNEKNLKLLEIAGFTWVDEKRHSTSHGPEFEGYDYTERVWIHEAAAYRTVRCPDLYNSLDAQIKWVLPKMMEDGWEFVIHSEGCDGCCQVLVWRDDIEIKPKACLPSETANALAEAILKAWEAQ